MGMMRYIIASFTRTESLFNVILRDPVIQTVLPLYVGIIVIIYYIIHLRMKNTEVSINETSEILDEKSEVIELLS